ncbi:hypothetical protein JYU34_004537 [Plutella xylostella]|uniref:Uncharacterized protein n=1 Tax=Plutella xylostella TaxID=51655 RepID=A0ABQ7QY97_PLUXY|nr:hypothetical protein JYU34_004537 [Plutella xylostella]
MRSLRICRYQPSSERKTEYRESLSDVPPLPPPRIYGAILDWDKMTQGSDNLGNGIA